MKLCVLHKDLKKEQWTKEEATPDEDAHSFTQCLHAYCCTGAAGGRLINFGRGHHRPAAVTQFGTKEQRTPNIAD